MIVARHSLDAWLALVEERLADVGRAGAVLLVMPEYACIHWLAFRPPGLHPAREVEWMAEQARLILPSLKDLVQKTGIGLLPGTMPAGNGGTCTNRAYFLLPDDGVG